MIEVEAGIEKICQQLIQQKRTVTVSILDAAGCVCGEDILAKTSVPNFVRSGMDGYAVRAIDTKGASSVSPVCLPVVDSIFAGDIVQGAPSINGAAVRIMTGAPIPDGYDAVIKQEWTDGGLDEVMIYQEIYPGMNRSEIGEDILAGKKIISQYQLLTSRAIGVLATQGIEEIKILSPIKVGLLATGDELASVGSPLSEGKIYNSNLYILAAAIQESGGIVVFKEHCSDETNEIVQIIKHRIAEVDLLITTGGVSVGAKDNIAKAIQQLEGTCLFHFVNMKPGTPMMASVYDKHVILSLSGNPFASMVNFQLFYWPVVAYFMKCSALEVEKRKVQSLENIDKSGIRRFIRAFEKDGWVSVGSKKQYSSVFYNTLETNCLIDLPKNKEIKKGDYLTVSYWKN